MHPRLPKSGLLLRKRHRLATFTAALCLICFALAQGASQLTNTKRITALQLGQSAEGSRVTVVGDSLLDDYEAFSRGDRFYVRIPVADFVAPQPRFQGLGFEDVQVQKVGDGVVISFRLHPGANARVIGAANRLEVIFTSPNHFGGNSSATTVRNRVTRNIGAVRNPTSRSSSRQGSEVAGPMPPDSPVTNTDYAAPDTASTRATRSHTSQTDTLRNNPVSANAVPRGTPISASAPTPMATPYPTSTYSATYPPATATYTPAAVQPGAQTDDKYFGLERRIRAVVQWLSANKKISASVGVAALSLLSVVIFFSIRRRRNRRPVLAKASRVQPKFSPDNELDDMMKAGSESSKMSPGRYVDENAYESWSENTSTDGMFFEDLTASPTEGAYDEVMAPTTYDAPSEQSWEYLSESNPQAYKSRVQEEREVFEL